MRSFLDFLKKFGAWIGWILALIMAIMEFIGKHPLPAIVG